MHMGAGRGVVVVERAAIDAIRMEVVVRDRLQRCPHSETECTSECVCGCRLKSAKQERRSCSRQHGGMSDANRGRVKLLRPGPEELGAESAS